MHFTHLFVPLQLMKRLVTYLMAVLVLATMVTGCVTEGRRMAMRQGLDSINMVNRSGKPFTVQDVRPYVEFFDDHGEANDRLLAHYLLGLAYYDHGEAPMALQCYQDALDYADTTRTDCDYAQLSRVYAQMGNVFYSQGLFRQHGEYYKKATRYAWIGKDTLAALASYEQQSFAYRELGVVDSAIFVAENVADKYKEYGYPKDAAIAIGTILRLIIAKGEYEKAKQYMDIYEAKTGFFNSMGNIVSGREVYYNIKGYYYLRTGILDSSEYYFRKELCTNSNFNNQNLAAQGLAELFQQLHQPDSATKYVIYAYAMNDSMYAHQTTETIGRMQSMYDYSRHQEEARKESVKATHRAIIIWICIGLIIIICLGAIIIIRELTRKKEQSEQKYLQGQAIIEQVQQDIAKLRKNEEINKELISEKEQTIQEQETVLKALLRSDSDSQSLAERKLKTTDIYKSFEQLSVVGRQPSTDEWEQARTKLFAHYPGFGDFMQEHAHHLNDKEQKVCLLIRLGFKPSNIGSMLDISSSYVTELRSKMLQNLFRIAGDSKAFDKMLKEIY